MTNPTPQPPAPKKDSTAAFPTHHNVNDPRTDGFFAEQGMDLRDWFAGQAIAGWLSSDKVCSPRSAAAQAYQLAEAMMEARKV